MSAYPDAKFILTHRDPAAWLRSVKNTFIPLEAAQDQFPIWHMSLFDPFTREFRRMSSYFQRSLWGSAGRGTADRDEVCVERYLKQ